MCSENRLELAVAIFGTLLHGATLVTMNPMYTARELEHAFNLTRPRVVFASAAANAAVQAAGVGKCVSIQTIVLLDEISAGQRSSNSIGMEAFIGGAANQLYETPVIKPQAMGDKVALILFSSGTTGLPKGVELTEKNIMMSLAQAE